MPEFESLFDFNLKETMKKTNRRELLMVRFSIQGNCVKLLFYLKGKQFYLTPGLKPGRAWLKEVIECAGGQVDFKRKSLQEIKERNK